jgi:hypothetical protein
MVRSRSRLVITPATCGSAVSSAKVAPPLKSTRITASCSGAWVRASPVTSVRSSSLLPEPVAPTSSPCGPMPPSAASLRSSSTGSPPGRTPIGARSSAVRGRRQVSATSRAAASSPRSSSRRVPASGPDRPRTAVSSSRRGASRRAIASQNASPAWSACTPPSRRPPGAVSCRLAVPRWSSSTRAPSSDGSPARSAASQRTAVRAAAARSSSSARTGRRAAALPGRRSSSTTSRYGGASRPGRRCGPEAGAAPPGRASPSSHRSRGRAARSSRAASCSLVSASRQAAGSASPASRLCGSHFSQSQAGRAAGGNAARIWRSSGAWRAAAWHRMERARARVRWGGPVSARTPCRARETVTGAAGRTAACSTSVSAAASSSGSWSTSGPPPWSSRIGAASGTCPVPTRTVRKSASADRRSQRRSARLTSAQSRGRSGWSRSATARWAVATCRAAAATRSRWAR